MPWMNYLGEDEGDFSTRPLKKSTDCLLLRKLVYITNILVQTCNLNVFWKNPKLLKNTGERQETMYSINMHLESNS